MAVSHQWFIQWSEPSMIFADITSKYNNINNWNNLEHKLSDSTAFLNEEDIKIVDSHRERSKVNRYKHRQDKDNSDRNRAALALWLTMLGVAQPQSIPADKETPPLNTLYKWKHMDFEFPSEWERQYAISTGRFIPDSVLPLGLEVWGDRVWVTLPHWRNGLPATLATVSRAGGVTSPRLNPYPDWTYHRAYSSSHNCSGLTSVFRINVDPCGRLWVLDSGKINSQDNPQQVCPPSIVVFDLNTDQLLARYLIPEQYVLQDSLYANIVVDARNEDCSDLHAYLADTWRFGLVVFRQSDAKFWRFSNPYLYPDPLASNFTLHGLNFQWADGVFGLSLSPINQFDDRILFFNSLASYRQFYVPTSILQQESHVNNSASEFRLLGESRGLTGQASACAIDRRGVMFYGLVMRDSVGCWDSRTPYQRRTQGVVASNSETIIFPNDVKVDQDRRQSVWVITNRLPMFQAGRLTGDEYNYRILYADTEEAVRNTVCDPSEIVPHSNILLEK